MGRTAQRGDLPLIKDPFAKPNMPRITLAGGNEVPKPKLLLLLLLAIGLAFCASSWTSYTSAASSASRTTYE